MSTDLLAIRSRLLLHAHLRHMCAMMQHASQQDLRPLVTSKSNAYLEVCFWTRPVSSILKVRCALCAQDFVAQLNKNGQRWVPILDPPIHIKPGYAAYDSGIAQDVFVKDITGEPYVGQVESATHTALLHSEEAACSPEEHYCPDFGLQGHYKQSSCPPNRPQCKICLQLSVVLLLHWLPSNLH